MICTIAGVAKEERYPCIKMNIFSINSKSYDCVSKRKGNGKRSPFRKARVNQRNPVESENSHRLVNDRTLLKKLAFKKLGRKFTSNRQTIPEAETGMQLKTERSEA
jgi:hypothetical protein